MRCRKIRMNMYVKVLLLCTSGILMAVLLMASLLSYSSAKIIYEQSKNTNIQLLERLQDEVSDQVKHMEDMLISVYNNESLLRDLTTHETYDVMLKNHFREAYLLAQQFDVEDGVVAIYIYDDFNRLISSYCHASTPVYQYPENPFSGTEDCNSRVLRKFLRSDSDTMLISGYYNENRKTDIVRFAVNIFSQDGTYNQIGAVVCDMDSAVFSKRLEKYDTQEGNLLWLQPANDRALVRYGSEPSGVAAEIMNMVEAGTENESLNQILQGQILFCLPLENHNLNLYSLMPQTLLTENQKAINQSMLTIAVMLILIFAVISVLVAKGITKPLGVLTRTMRRIQGGETELRVDKLGNDEIGELGSTFNQMLDQVETLLVQEYQMKLAVQRAKYNALQAQINPHFLYNTLDTMSSIAQIQGCDAVSDLSESLSGIFRYTLDMSDAFTTVEKELIHLKNYIYVMDVRMHNEVQYVLDVQESVLSCKLPRLTLQPLVENAITHGVRGVRHEKQIRVNITQEGDTLVISVCDNGAGTDADRINQRLQKNDPAEIEKGVSIGLVNINARIRMLYGEEYGVRVESTPEVGTTVQVRLPAKEDQRYGL